MTKFTFLCLLFVGSICLFSFKASTQVTDPDFRLFLIQKYPGCYNSTTDVLDLTCAAIVNEDSLFIRNQTMYNLSGLEVFSNLVYLDISGTGDILGKNLVVPALPSTLKTYICRGMGSLSPEFFQLILFPANLPPGLERIDAAGSRISSFTSTLPATLKYLDVSNCNLINSIPALPSALDTLKCSGIRSSAFDGSTTTYYGLTSLPTLPSTLKYLDCSSCRLSSLPALPGSLTYLDCNNNTTPSSGGPTSGITSMPALPAGLIYLNCRSNKIVGFPTLPPTLEYLDCASNRIGGPLPSLPDALTFLDFSFSSVTSVQSFPNGLKEIRSYGNAIHALPSLPDSLEVLLCYNNMLSVLPSLPAKLNTLVCGSNNITCIPRLPASMGQPPIGWPANLSVGAEVTCLPNHIPGMIFSSLSGDTSLPLCTPINNVNQCPTAPVMSGTIYYDHNSNGVRDAGENGRANVKIQSAAGLESFSNIDGYFEIGGDTGANTITIVSPSPYTSVPANASYNFSSFDTTVTGSYALQPGVIIDSLVVSIVPQNIARPGFDMNYILNWENTGTTQFSTQMQLIFEDANMIYQNASVPGVTAAGGILTIPAFATSPGDRGSIMFEFVMRTTATLGDTMLTAVTASVNAGFVKDSIYQLIRGSFDPNDKGATPILTSAQVSDGTFIDYLIRFQNTGTDTAFNVVVTDTLSSLLDASSFEMIATSHPSKNLRDGNKLLFEFINILLPDSNVNEPQSHGYIMFRIKPVNTLSIGTVVPNNAHIYFDYNAPVITNVATTKVQDPVVCFTLTATSTPATCPGVNNGAITVTPTGGLAPFSYSLDGGTAQSSETFTGVSAGAHTVLVTDANSCTASVSVTITSGSGINATAATTASACGQSTGTVIVTATSGATPYIYTLGGGTPQSSETFAGVPAGTHNVEIVDANGCNFILTAVVAETPISATVVVTQPTCTTQGSIEVTGSTGAAPLVYAINGGTPQSSPVFSNLAAGSYIVNVQDANLCSYTETVTVNSSPATVTPSVNITASATTVCLGDDVTFTATSTNGGTTPAYQWMVNGVNAGTNAATFTSGFSANGIVSVQLTSNNPCASPTQINSNDISITVNPVQSATVTISGNTTVNAGDASTISSSVTNAGTTVTYQWQDSTALHTWTNIPGATSASISYTALQTGDKLRCVITGNAPCLQPADATSNVLVFTVIPATTTPSRVYPNPATTEVIVQFNPEPWRVAEILDGTGRKLLEVNNASAADNARLPVQMLPAGTYYIRIRYSSGMVEHLPFIKQH